MNDLMDALFGPLGYQYCYFFYYGSIIGFIVLVICFGHVVQNMFKGKGDMGTRMGHAVLLLINCFFMYFIYCFTSRIKY